MIIYTEPTFMYHATYNAYLDSILADGLGGVEHKNWDDSTGDVCLAPYPGEAESYAECAPDCGFVPEVVETSGIVILRIDVAGLLLKVDPNIDQEDVDCLVYSGIIHPNRIEVMHEET
jgi:hypothetical protein